MTDTAHKNGTTPGTVPVWDRLVRVFHWSLVAAFAVAWLSADELDALHRFAGYGIASLVAVRLVWGVIGTQPARFVRFVKGPRATLAYLGDMVRGHERRYLGHNPAGAAMIVVLLAALSGTAFTGWLSDEPARLALVPGAAWAGKDLMEDLHEVLANFLMFFVVLHLGGVIVASVRHRENLARAMITGDKRAPAPGDIA
ncbi:cytochrome b/b6 domain-containing protein [Yoonia sp.]|uniref:cytochrome b/b6 domain-containing protein n=1 Tax=Yoonia sp. TaxID=2212373 RepID=UPI0019E0F7C0|nr:cytochrome b/b6 domain-containing protein [Yoonia sp.]MBE0413731.1 cytochrome b/b6 domain-containing protein [Yoonia sp.]